MDGLHEACERLLAYGQLPASKGERPHLLDTVEHGRLAAGVGVGTLADGTELPPAVVQRLACDAAVIRAVLGGPALARAYCGGRSWRISRQSVE